MEKENNGKGLVSFDIIFNTTVPPGQYVKNFLEYTAEDHDVDISDIKLLTELDNAQGVNTFSKFTITAPNNTSYVAFLNSFFENLKQEKEVVACFKYRDDFAFENNLKYFKEIYEVEMLVRELFTYILTVNYPNESIYTIKDRFCVDFIKETDSYSEDYYKKTLTNPLFFGTFKQYEELTKFQSVHMLQSKDSKTGERNFSKLKKYKSLEEFKAKLDASYIRNKKHREVIEGLQDSLKIIEPFRNAIAHNNLTEIDNNKMGQYKAAANNIIRVVSDFFKEEQDDISRVMQPALKAKDLLKWLNENKADLANYGTATGDDYEDEYLNMMQGPGNALDEEFPYAPRREKEKALREFDDQLAKEGKDIAIQEEIDRRRGK